MIVNPFSFDIDVDSFDIWHRRAMTLAPHIALIERRLAKYGLGYEPWLLVIVARDDGGWRLEYEPK